MSRLYKGPAMKRNLSDAIKSYNSLWNLWFNFGKQTGKVVSENEIIITLEFDPDFRFLYYIAIGWLECFFEGYLGKKVFAKFLEKSWETGEKTIFNLTW